MTHQIGFVRLVPIEFQILCVGSSLDPTLLKFPACFALLAAGEKVALAGIADTIAIGASMKSLSVYLMII